LPDLVGFRLPLAILGIDPRISWPWGLVNPMARSFLSWFAKIMPANCTEIREFYITGVFLHFFHKFVYFVDGYMVSIVILNVKGRSAGFNATGRFFHLAPIRSITYP
jgi:hypothetical protein